MEHNCNFNKAAILVDFRRLLWRLKAYKRDATKAGHPLCKAMINEIEKDLHKHCKKLEKAVVGLAKEGKYSFCEKC